METTDVIFKILVIIAIIISIVAIWNSYHHPDGTIEVADLDKSFKLTGDKIASNTITQENISWDYIRDDYYRYMEEYFQRVPGLGTITSGTTGDYLGDAGTAGQLSFFTTNKNLNYFVPSTTLGMKLVDDTTTALGSNTVDVSADGLTIQGTTTNGIGGIIVSRATAFFSTNNMFSFTASFSLSNITNPCLKLGLFNAIPTLAQYSANPNCAYFAYDPASTQSDEGLVSGVVAAGLNQYLLFIYSTAGTDYITAIPITVAVNTQYIVKMNMDNNKKISIWVNGTQYSVNSTSAGAATADNAAALTSKEGTAVSAAMTADVNLLSAVRHSSAGATASVLTVNYLKGNTYCGF